MKAAIVRSRKYTPVMIKKAFKVLRLFLDKKEGLGTSEIARRASLAKSTVFGILEDLTREGWISKDPMNKKYTLGAGLVELAWTVFNQAAQLVPSVQLHRGNAHQMRAGRLRGTKAARLGRSALVAGGM